LYIDGVDLLKIDVQGSEKDILEGSFETLKRTNHILLECSFSNYNSGAPQIEDVVDFIKKNKFYPMAILEEHWSRPGIDLPVHVVHQIDVLFSNIKHSSCELCEKQIKEYRQKYEEAMK
jgi:hypothetical protein